MAIKFKGNTLFTTIDAIVTDMMVDLDPADIADFGNGSRIPAYSKFLECFGSVYNVLDTVVADNELGWQFMRYGFNHSGMPYEGLTPPTVVGKSHVEVWMSRFIMAALSLARHESQEAIVEQYINSVPVLVGAAVVATLNDEKGAVLRRELTRGDKFFDAANPIYNSTAGIRNCDEKKLDELIKARAMPGDIVSQRIFFVKVLKWMEWMFNKTHPLANKQAKFESALRQKAIESILVTLTIAHRENATMIPAVPDKAHLETVCDELADGNEYTKFKTELMAEIIDEWNNTTYYAHFTPDTLIYNAINNEMIASDLFAYRHRILSVLGDEALSTCF